MSYSRTEQTDVQHEEGEQLRKDAFVRYQSKLAEIRKACQASFEATSARDGKLERQQEAQTIGRHQFDEQYGQQDLQQGPQPQYQPSPYHQSLCGQDKSVQQERPESESLLLPERWNQRQEPQAREEGPEWTYDPNEHVPTPGRYQPDDDCEDNSYAGVSYEDDNYEDDNYDDDDYEDDNYEDDNYEDDSEGYGQLSRWQQHDTYWQGGQYHRGY